MKRTFRRALGCAGALCAVLLALLALCRLMEKKDSRVKYEPFFAQKEDFDVLFFGTSHVIDAVDPMALWDDCGIVSYNMGGHGNPLPVTYWVLRNALDHTTPRLAVIDCFYLASNTKLSDKYEYTHLSFDAFPLSRNKIAAALDLSALTPDDTLRNKESIAPGQGFEPIGLLWDFTEYHERWQYLERADFDVQPSARKGGDFRTELTAPAALLDLPRSDKLEGDTLGVVYLERMIEECQARGIQVLLTYLPFPAVEARWQEANRVYDIAEKYGVPYINFLTWDGIDYTTDCADADSHLNIFGAQKVTRYLGQYLTQNFDLPDRRADAAYAGWNTDYQTYRQSLDDLLRRQNRLDSFLLTAFSGRYDLLLMLEDRALLTEEPYASIFRQTLGIDAAACPEGPLLLAWPGAGPAQVWPLNGPLALDIPPLGQVQVDGQTVCLDGTEYLSVLPEGRQAGLRAIVLDAATGAFVHAINFDLVSRTLEF